MQIGKLTSKAFDLVQEQPENLKEIRNLLTKMQACATEISDEGLQMYMQDFTETWLSEGYLEDDFESFSSELNELVVELGNEGYFGEDD